RGHALLQHPGHELETLRPKLALHVRHDRAANRSRRMRVLLRSLAAALVLLALSTGDAASSISTFSNSTPIAISGNGASSGTQVFVQGFSGPPTSIVVSISRLTHPQVGNLDLVLVGPTGAAFVLQGACGGSSSATNVSLTFSDAAA